MSSTCGLLPIGRGAPTARVVAQIPAGAVLLLVENFATRRAWAEALNATGKHQLIDLSGRMTGATEKIREPFVDELVRLGGEHDSPEWWCSRVGERNPLVSHLFLNICLLRMAVDVLYEYREPISVLSDREPVLAAIADNVGPRCYWLGPRSRMPRVRIRDVVPRVLWFAAVSAARRVQSPRRALTASDVIIHTHLRSSSPLETVGDPYNPGLCQWMERQGLLVQTLAYAPQLRGYGRLLRRMRSSGLDPLPDHRLYRIVDYVYAIRAGWRSARMCFDPAPVDRLNVKAVFDFETVRTAFDFGTLEALLRTRLALRMAERGVAPGELIMEYENMVLERGTILGFRTWSPQTCIVGVQHGALAPNILCHFARADEVDEAPLPDRVVCAGPLFRELLTAAGLPDSMVDVGVALRYRHFESAPGPKCRQLSSSGSGVLVLLPMMLDEAEELLSVAMEAFARDSSVSVILRPHPMANMDVLMGRLRVSHLPPNFSVDTGPIDGAMGRAAVAVGLASSALLEAALLGIPVVFVSRDIGIEFDQLAWSPELRQSVSTSEQLGAAVAAAIRRNDSMPVDALTALRKGYFAPFTERGMRVFACSQRSMTKPGSRHH